MPRPSQEVFDMLADWPTAVCPAHVHREAARRITAELLELDTLPEADDDMPSVTRDPAGPVGEFPEHSTRTDRYAYAGALGIEVMKRQLIFDPSQPSEVLSARLKRVRQGAHPNPYLRLAEDLHAGFRASDDEFVKEQPEKARRLKAYHDALLAQDSSRHVTRIPVSSESIGGGNEGPFEATGAAALVQLLTAGSQYDTAEKRLEITHGIIDTTIKERMTWNILTFVCGRSLYVPPSLKRPDLIHFDIEVCSLDDRSQKTPQTPFRVDFGAQKTKREQSPLLEMKCPMMYAKPEGYRRSYVELYMHATANEAYADGLLDPGRVPEY